MIDKNHLFLSTYLCPSSYERQHTLEVPTFFILSSLVQQSILFVQTSKLNFQDFTLEIRILFIVVLVYDLVYSNHAFNLQLLITFKVGNSIRSIFAYHSNCKVVLVSILASTTDSSRIREEAHKYQRKEYIHNADTHEELYYNYHH